MRDEIIIYLCRTCANLTPEPKQTPLGTYPLTCRHYHIGIKDDQEACSSHYVPIKSIEQIQPKDENMDSDIESNRNE